MRRSHLYSHDSSGVAPDWPLPRCRQVGRWWHGSRVSRLRREAAAGRRNQAAPPPARCRRARTILHEARTSSALNHPGICTVYEVDDHEDQSFIVMELVEGRPLSDLIPADGFPFESRAAAMELQIAERSPTRTRRGVIHRDVKPSNILVNGTGPYQGPRLRSGRSTIGPQIARPHDGVVEASSESGVLAGTLAYMSPEQLRGERAAARSDVWSLRRCALRARHRSRPYAGDTAVHLECIHPGRVRPGRCHARRDRPA